MSKILQLKISLKDSHMNIWRRFLVEDSITFHKLHLIIQKVMGWQNYHLYMFNLDGIEIGEPDPDYDRGIIDSKKIKLNKLLISEKKKFFYEYDFGDGWEHLIIIEKILEKDKSKKYPVCIAGERNCPPEDCGGVYGYEEMLKIVQDKSHPDYKMWSEWAGKFDPEKFDVGKVNKVL